MKQKIITWLAIAAAIAAFIGCSALGDGGDGPSIGEYEAHLSATRGE